MQGAGSGAGERCESRRERRFQLGLHLDVFEELVRQIAGESGLDLFVLEQLLARVDPVVGVERLPIDPDREDGEEGDQGAYDQQRRDDARVS